MKKLLKKLKRKCTTGGDSLDRLVRPLDTKLRSGYRVVGPNTADYRQSTWYMPTLEEAKRFANHIAAEVDAEYDILKYVGSVRQVPLPPRPIEWVEAKRSSAPGEPPHPPKKDL